MAYSTHYLERDTVAAAEPRRGGGEQVAEDEPGALLRRVVAQGPEIAVVGREGAYGPVAGVVVDGHGVRGVRGAGDRHLARPPRLESLVEQIGEDPAVGGVGDGVQGGETHGTVVGGVPRAGRPGVVVVESDDEFGAVPPDGARQVAAQAGPVLDRPVGVVVEEVDLVHAEFRGGLALFGLAHGPALRRRKTGDARLAPGDEEVRHLAPLGGPLGHGGAGTELDVVGVGDDREHAAEVVGQFEECVGRVGCVSHGVSFPVDEGDEVRRRRPAGEPG
jgi:hypothetical protein